MLRCVRVLDTQNQQEIQLPPCLGVERLILFLKDLAYFLVGLVNSVPVHQASRLKTRGGRITVVLSPKSASWTCRQV